MVNQERYVPAAGRRSFAALYDPIMALSMRERAFRRAVTKHAVAQDSPDLVLDVGCGTGTQLVELARHAPSARLVGVDGDADILRRARAKIGAAGASVELAELHRVLRRGGRLIIVDWGRPHDPLMRGSFFLVRLLDGRENTRDHAAGRLPDFIRDAGFGAVEIAHRWRAAWGSLELLLAERSDDHRA